MRGYIIPIARSGALLHTHNIPHTVPLSVIIEDVVLGWTGVGWACEGKGRDLLVIPLDPSLHHLLLDPLHLNTPRNSLLDPVQPNTPRTGH